LRRFASFSSMATPVDLLPLHGRNLVFQVRFGDVLELFVAEGRLLGSVSSFWLLSHRLVRIFVVSLSALCHALTVNCYYSCALHDFEISRVKFTAWILIGLLLHVSFEVSTLCLKIMSHLSFAVTLTCLHHCA